LKNDAKVVDYVGENGKKWPRDWNGRFMEVLNVLVVSLRLDIEDKAFLIDMKGNEKVSSVKEVWKEDCEKDLKVRLILKPFQMFGVKPFLALQLELLITAFEVSFKDLFMGLQYITFGKIEMLGF
nr:hypothetical protein [Tanacetum cinerariifolium]